MYRNMLPVQFQLMNGTMVSLTSFVNFFPSHYTCAYIYICIWGALTLALEHLSSIGLGALPQGPSNQRPPLYVCYHLQYLNAAQNLGSKVGPVDVLVVRGGGHRSRT